MPSLPTMATPIVALLTVETTSEINLAQREMHLQDRLIGLEQHLAVFQSAGLHAR